VKKIKTLQILVYVTFSLYFVQNFGSEIYKGAIDGFNDSADINEHRPLGPALFTVLDGGMIPGVKNDSLQVGKDYLLRDIKISTEIRVTNSDIEAPQWIRVIKVLLTVLIINLLGYTASFINKIMFHVYQGTMFETTCIRLIRKTGVYILLYAVADYAIEWMDFLKEAAVIHAPLKLINTVSFGFGTLLCGIFIFIIAEAFKQGAQLKEEQELTI
jgi:hypothetical protein